MSLSPGSVVGRFRVVSLLGAGGMGEVYLARDESLDRSVALKILPPELVKNDERVRRFVQEAKSASSLSHPNIVTIHEIGEAGGVHFIAMEFVRGRTLKDLIHTKGVDLRTLIRYLAQAAEGVAKAHAAGIVHRDLKPENIMVSDDGYAKVLDFGLAKLVETAPLAGSDQDAAPTATVRRTGDGVILGTIGYMSPEQIQARAVDHRSDIFSFGCILYEAAARRRPFAADSDVETLHAILKDAPVAIETLTSHVPADVRRLIRRCLAKSPDQRLQSMKDLALELADIAETYDALSASGSGATPSISGTGVAVRGRSRWEWTAIAAAIVLGAGGLAFGGWTLLGGRRDTGQRPASFGAMEITRLAAIAGLDSAALSPDGRHLAYATTQTGRSRLFVRQLATGRDLDVVPPQVGEILFVAFSPDGSYVFYEQWGNPGPTTLFQVASLGGAPRRIATLALHRWAISPDGSQIAASTGDKGIDSLIVLNVDGTARRTVTTLKAGESLWTVAWSPDGQRIVGSVERRTSGGQRGDRLVEFSVRDGSEQALGSRVWSALTDVKWLPDGSGLVVAAQGLNQDTFQLWWVSWPDGASRRITNDANHYYDATVSADSKSIAAVNTRETANVWIAPMANLQAATRVDGDDAEDFVAIRDGSVLFRRRERDGRHRNLWSLAPDGSPPRRLTPARLDTGLPYPAAGANIVVFVSYGDDGDRTLWRMDLDGGGLAEIPGGGNKEVRAVSPDGLTVYFSRVVPRDQPSDPVLYRMPVAGGTEEKTAANDSATRGRFSHDGKYSFRFPAERDTRPGAPDRREIVSADTGKVLRTIESPERFENLQWAPSGEALTFIRTIDGIANIWRIPIDGRPAQQITRFVSGQLDDDYGWLGDGSRLVFRRREQTPSEVLLIRNFR